MNKERLDHVRKVGFEPIDLTVSDRLGDLVEAVLGVPEVDAPWTVWDPQAERVELAKRGGGPRDGS